MKKRSIVKGDPVMVRYLSNETDSARIDSFSYHWGERLALLALGVPFLWIGLWNLRTDRQRKRNKERLSNSGMEALAEIKDIWHDCSIGGRSPCIIVCQWLNPHTSHVHVFESDEIWFEPSDFIGDRKSVFFWMEVIRRIITSISLSFPIWLFEVHRIFDEGNA